MFQTIMNVYPVRKQSRQKIKLMKVCDKGMNMVKIQKVYRKIKEPLIDSGSSRKAGQIIFMEQPGQTILTEGFHDLSVDFMNTSFSLVSCKNIN